jgi:Predicted ornithine cyclodeaminase, mu-crystallin homolog
MKHITEEDVRKNLRMDELMDILEDSFIEYGEGHAESSARDRIFTGGGVLNSMPASIQKYGIAGSKIYYADPENAKFVVMIFKEDDPENYFVIDANFLGQMRTAALPGMVSRKILQGRKDLDFLLVGSGLQAETQLEAMKVALNLDNASVFSRNTQHARKFVEKMQKKLSMDLKVEESRANIARYNVINTVTNTKDPIIDHTNAPESYHMNLVGANLPNRREVSSEVMHMTDLIVVEHADQAMKESVEIQDVMGQDKLVELKDFIREGTGYNQRTIFKTMGIGLEDIVSGYIVLRNMGIF